VASTEIDARCLSGGNPDFDFTTRQIQPASSVFGAFGGTWDNTWEEASPASAVTCPITFSGSSLQTCDGGQSATSAGASAVVGITFQYADGGNSLSGNAWGWAEFAATRQ
jgi:hypothetical protein